MGSKRDGQLFVNEMKGKITDILCLYIEAVVGNPIAVGKLAYYLGKGFFSISDRLFYAKFDLFLKGVSLDNHDYAKMGAYLAGNGDQEGNCLQLLTHINNAISKTKVKYLAYATRFALAYKIPLPVYFRICAAINTVMEEDLQFLADNIDVIDDAKVNHFESNQHTQMLFAIGAMRIITTAWKNGDYAFSPFARLMDACTISFDDDTRYPNPRKVVEEYTNA